MPERNSFDQNILTAIWLNELRSQVTSFTENTLTYRRRFRPIAIQQRARLALLRVAFRPTAAGAAFPRPPMIAVGVSINYTFAGNGHVLLLTSIAQRRIVHQLHDFPPRAKDEQVLHRIA